MSLDFLPATDPMSFLVDDEIRPFDIDKRQDLTGTGTQACPIVSTGVYIVHEHEVPDNTAEVVLNVFPHAWRRTNVGLPDEGVAIIDPMLIAGFVLFDNARDNNQPYLVEHDYNIATVAGTPNNLNRSRGRGATLLSNDQPLMRAAGMKNALSPIYLPPKSKFRVLFQLVASIPAVAGPPITGGIPNPFVIGTNVVNVDYRIDFAGAYVSGVRMPVQTYDQLKTARRKGFLGAEARARRDVVR